MFGYLRLAYSRKLTDAERIERIRELRSRPPLSRRRRLGLVLLGVAPMLLVIAATRFGRQLAANVASGDFMSSLIIGLLLGLFGGFVLGVFAYWRLLVPECPHRLLIRMAEAMKSRGLLIDSAEAAVIERAKKRCRPDPAMRMFPVILPLLGGGPMLTFIFLLFLRPMWSEGNLSLAYTAMGMVDGLSWMALLGFGWAMQAQNGLIVEAKPMDELVLKYHDALCARAMAGESIA